MLCSSSFDIAFSMISESLARHRCPIIDWISLPVFIAVSSVSYVHVFSFVFLQCYDNTIKLSPSPPRPSANLL